MGHEAQNAVFLADNMEVMKKFPDKYFDLVVADPPYFSGPERRKYYGKAKSTTGVLRHEYPVTDKWTVPGPEYFREIQRIGKKYIIFGCNYFDFVFDPGRIVWDKCNGRSTFSDCEIAATNCHDSVRLFRYMWNGMMQGKNMTEGATMRGNKKLNDVRIHPTQKPIDLYRWIFHKYAFPGAKVFDPNVGSGTSRRAAWEMGIEFIGCEIEEEYWKLQEAAYKEHIAQERMDGVWT